jgi:hypothetical protein
LEVWVKYPSVAESPALQYVVALKLAVTSDVEVGVIIGFFFLLFGLLLRRLRFGLLLLELRLKLLG